MLWKLILLLPTAVVALLLIALGRTLLTPATPAKTAQPPKSDPARARLYGEKLGEMIRYETVSHKGETDFAKYRAFQEGLRPLFPNIFAHCEITHPLDQLVIRYPAAGKPKGEPILLMSHQDVVPVVADGWKHPPFSGHIDENGTVWGRGTVDTKGALMCELQALEELIAAGWKPEKDVYITSSCTEEWGGPGAPAIVSHLKEKGVHLGMLLDEGGMIMGRPISGVEGRYCMVGCLEKGSGSVRLVARGKGGHSSAPPKNSPLVRLGKLMVDIDKKSPFKAEFHPVVREMFGRLGPNANFGMKYVFTNLWLFGPILKRVLGGLVPVADAMLRTTCAFTRAEGSTANNVIPREASVTANLRYVIHQPGEESLAVLRERAAKYDIEVEDLGRKEPCPAVDHTAAPFKLLEEVSAEIYPGYDVVPYSMTGGTDARFYGEICDHCLRFAPIEINNAQFESIHSNDECLDSAALPPAVDFYKRILEIYCSR